MCDFVAITDDSIRRFDAAAKRIPGWPVVRIIPMWDRSLLSEAQSPTVVDDAKVQHG